LPYCRRCGKEIGEDVKYCPSCGAAVDAAEAIYRKPARGISVGKILALIFGGLLLLVSFGIIAGGGAIIWAQNTMMTPEGFMMSGPFRLHTSTWALAVQNIDIGMDPDAMKGIWEPTMADIVTIKLMASSNDPSKDVFIGIASAEDAEAYLNGVSYDEIQKLSWQYSPWQGGVPTVTYTLHSGSPPTQPPSTVTFWAASAHGSGEQTIEWVPKSGTYWIIVMNADVLKDIDINMQLGAKVPILSGIANGLIVGGIIGLVVGCLIIYYGAVRRW